MYAQRATLRRVTGAHESDGTPVYGSARTIAVRWEGQSLRGVWNGAEVVSEKGNRVFTEAPIGNGDELTYEGAVYHVTGIQSVPTLDGRILMREVRVE